MNNFRKDVIALDWKDDGRVTFGGNKGYGYLSADKVKKQFAPLLAKHKLELIPEYSDLQCLSPRDSAISHFTVLFKCTLIDIETGDSVTGCAYGEGVDSGDKAIAKAQTAAFKAWAISSYSLADGIDPEGGVVEQGFTIQSNTEKEAVKSRVLDAAIAPPAPVVSAPAPAEKPKTPVKAKETKVAATTTPAVPAPAPAAAPPSLVPVPLAKAMQHILDAAFRSSQAGEMSLEDYNALLTEHGKVNTSIEASDFIRRHKL